MHCSLFSPAQTLRGEYAKLEAVVAKCKAAYDKADAALTAEKERISAADKKCAWLICAQFVMHALMTDIFPRCCPRLA